MDTSWEASGTARRRRWGIAIGGLAAVGVALLVGLSLPSLLSRRCRSAQVEARAELERVVGLQRAHHEERGVYARTLEALGYAPREAARYRVRFVEAADAAFVIEAIGTDLLVEGDVWRVNHAGELRAVIDRCAETETSAGPRAGAADVSRVTGSAPAQALEITSPTAAPADP